MKQALRLRARALAPQINKDWHTEVSTSVCSRLYDALNALDYQSIGLYMPMRDEIDVRPLIAKLLSEGKDVYLPRVLDQSTIAFFPFHEGDTLETNGLFALSEPRLDSGRREFPLDVLIVPAVHFHNGYRLGRGKGYYDRYLAKYPPRKFLAGITLGILGNASFIPDKWDIPMPIVFAPQPEDSRLSALNPQG